MTVAAADNSAEESLTPINFGWVEDIPGKVSYNVGGSKQGKHMVKTDQYRPVVPQIPAQCKGESGINEAFSELDVTTCHGEICNHFANCNLSRCGLSASLLSQKLTMTE